MTMGISLEKILFRNNLSMSLKCTSELKKVKREQVMGKNNERAI